MNEVVVLFTIGTAADAPTPTVPPIAMLPAMTLSVSCSFAEMRALPPARTVARDVAQLVALTAWALHTSPTYAFVTIVNTDTAALRATPTVPPAETPAEIEMTFSLEAASIVTEPLARTETCGSIQAWVSLFSSSTSAPAPMPAEPPTASWPATPLMVVVSVALSETPWVAEAPALLELIGRAAVDVGVGDVVQHIDGRGTCDGRGAADRAADGDRA